MLSPQLRRKIHDLWSLFWTSGLSNPLVAAPKTRSAPRVYANPFPGVAGGDFESNVRDAYCWRPLSPAFYSRLQNEPPLTITVSAQRSGTDNVIRFRSNLPLQAAGVWTPPADPITNVASQPGLSFQVVNSLTHTWRDGTYALANGPLQPDTDYGIAYESGTSRAGQPSQFSKIGLFPPNRVAVQGTVTTVP